MFNNISVLVLLALFASAMGEINMKEMEEAKEKCVAETGIDPEVLKEVPTSLDGPVDEKMKCFGACMINQRGGFKEDGTFDLEKGIAAIPEDMPKREKIVEALTACADKKGANDCETAYEIFVCLREKKALIAE